MKCRNWVRLLVSVIVAIGYNAQAAETELQKTLRLRKERQQSQAQPAVQPVTRPVVVAQPAVQPPQNIPSQSMIGPRLPVRQPSHVPHPPAYPKPSVGGIPVAPALPAVTRSPEELKRAAALQIRREQKELKYAAESKRLKAKAGELPNSGIMVMPRTLTVGYETTAHGKEALTITPPSQGLVILLDDSEVGSEFGALTQTTWAALQYKVPVLVSASLMKNIFDRPRGNPVLDLSNASPEDRGRVANDFVRDLFKPQEWVIRRVGESLLLLLPVSRVKGIGAAESDPAKFTKRELDLGLKIDHMASLDEKTFFAFLAQYEKPKSQDYFINALGDGSIFVTRTEYAARNAVAQQLQWTIYLGGHGLLGTTIAALQIADFRKTLDFFESKIITKFLVVVACYSAGTNIELAYADMGKQEQKKYSFPIAIEASPDTSSKGVGSLHVLGNRIKKLEFSYNYKEFFEKIWGDDYQNNPYDVVRITTSIFAVFQKDVVSSSNYPQVRPANREYFISLFPGIEIGSAMIASYTNPPKPLDVVKVADQKGAKWDWLYVVLRADAPKVGSMAKQYIEFPLILNHYAQKHAPIMLSFAPGAHVAFHRIKQIISDYSWTDIIQPLIETKHGMRKIFWIEKFDDARGKNTNVIIDIHEQSGTVYITDPAGKRWLYEVKENTLQQPISTNAYVDTYDKLFNSKMQTIPGVDAQNLLLDAIKNINIALAKQALAMGANPNASYNGTPLLHWIAYVELYKENAAEIAQLLINAVAKEAEDAESARHEPALAAITGTEPESEASRAKAKAYAKQVSKSKEAGAKAAEAYIDSVYLRITPLIAAASYNNTLLVRVLLANKANVNATAVGQAAQTALAWAIINANQEMLRLLLEAGADVANGLAYARAMADPKLSGDPKKYGPVVALLEQWEKEKKGKSVGVIAQPQLQPQQPVDQQVTGPRLPAGQPARGPRPPSYPKPGAQVQQLSQQVAPVIQQRPIAMPSAQAIGQVDIEAIARAIKGLYDKVRPNLGAVGKPKLDAAMRLFTSDDIAAGIAGLRDVGKGTPLAGDVSRLLEPVVKQGLQKQLGDAMKRLFGW